MTKRFNTIDGETLMTMPLKPINFIVENLLSEGLHILAGITGKEESLGLHYGCL